MVFICLRINRFISEAYLLQLIEKVFKKKLQGILINRIEYSL